MNTSLEFERFGRSSRSLQRPAPPLVRAQWPARPGARPNYPIIFPPWREWRSVGEPIPAARPAPPSIEHVRWVQSCLNRALRLQLGATGVMDAATRSALRSFQRRHDLPTNGIIGPPTVAALRAECVATPPRPPSPEFELVPAASAGYAPFAASASPCGCAGAKSKSGAPCGCGCTGGRSRKGRPCSCGGARHQTVSRRPARGLKSWTL